MTNATPGTEPPFRRDDRVRLDSVHAASNANLREFLGREGVVTAVIEWSGQVGVQFTPNGYDHYWINPRRLSNLTRPLVQTPPDEGTDDVVTRSGLPGYAGFLALSLGKSIRFRTIVAGEGRWGRDTWRGENDFVETSRYEVLVDGRRLGDVWRATGRSYWKDRHVWLAAPGGVRDFVACSINSQEDLRSSRRLAGLNVAGSALFSFDVDGTRLFPVDAVYGIDGGFERIRYFVDDGEGGCGSLNAIWHGTATRHSPAGYEFGHVVREGREGRLVNHRHPDRWEDALAEAVAAISGWASTP